MINLVSQKAGEIENLRQRIDQFSKSQEVWATEKEEFEKQLTMLTEEKADCESELKNQLKAALEMGDELKAKSTFEFSSIYFNRFYKYSSL